MAIDGFTDRAGFSEYAGDPAGVAAYRAQRQRALMGDLLLKQGLQKPQGQMVGRFYVPQSWAQDLSSMVQQGLGAGLTERAGQQGITDAEQRVKMNTDAIEQYQRKMREAQGGQTVEALGPGAPVVDPNAPPPAAAPAPPAYGLAPSPTPPQAPPPQMMEGARPTAVTPPDLMAQKNLMREALMSENNPGLIRAAGIDTQQAFQEKEHAAQREQALEMRKQQNELMIGLAGFNQKAAMQRTDLGKVQIIDALLAETDPGSNEFKTLTDMKAKLVAIPGAGSDIVLKDTDTGIMRASKSTGKTSALLAPDQKTPLQPMDSRPAITTLVNAQGEPEQVGVGRGSKKTVLGTSWQGSTPQANQALKIANEKEFVDGPAAKSLRSIGVAHSHLDTWLEAQQALRNEGVQGFNRVAAVIGKQFGVAAPTNLEGVASIVAPELVKAIVPGGGSQEERLDIQRHLGTALSPEQAQGLADQYRALMGGQAQGLHQQYMSGVGATEENWLKKLDPKMKQRYLDMQAATAPPAAASRPTVILKFNARGEQLP